MNQRTISEAFYSIKVIKITRLTILIILVSLSLYLIKNPSLGLGYDENGNENDLRGNIEAGLIILGILLFVLEVLHIREIGVVERNFYINVQEKKKPDNSPKVDENTNTIVAAIQERRLHRNSDELMKNN
jgi:hypothetical protein